MILSLSSEDYLFLCYDDNDNEDYDDDEDYNDDDANDDDNDDNKDYRR